jgi:hypothetical protein
MKPWHIALAVLGIAVVYILVKRPVIPITGTSTQANGNDLYRAIGNLAGLGTAIVGKVGAPAAGDGVATYNQGESFDDYTGRLFGPGTEG